MSLSTQTIEAVLKKKLVEGQTEAREFTIRNNTTGANKELWAKFGIVQKNKVVCCLLSMQEGLHF